jgi:hypothetical protein
MGHRFISEDMMVDPFITAIDSTLIKAKGPSAVWHKSSMNKGIVPRSGIDTEMQDGVIVIQRDGYLDKLHLISSTEVLLSLYHTICRFYNC